MPDYNPNSIWKSKNPPPDPVSSVAKQMANDQASATPAQPAAPVFSSNGKRSGGHGLIWFAAVLIILLGVTAAAIVILKNKPTPQLALSFDAPTQALVGNPFILTVSYQNNSAQNITNAQLSVLLPDGLSFLGQSATQRVLETNIGDLAAGETTSTEFKVIATQNPNSVQHIQATMTYAAKDATANYQTTGQTDIAIGPAALTFTFAGSQNVFSGQIFPITINYSNQSAQDVSDAQFVMQYPPAFHFVSSSLPLMAGSNNNMWDLGRITAGASSSLTVAGTISGPASALYPFSATMNGTFQGQTYPVATQSTNIAIAQAPLSLALSMNGTSSYISSAGDQLLYTLTYTNTSNVTFQSAIVTAKLTGSMFDFSHLQTDGSFSSITNTITWNAANDRDLAAIAPGASGQLKFSLGTRGSYPIRLVSDKNFILKVVGTISSPTVPSNTAGGNGTQSIVELDNKVAGDITIQSKGYYRDPEGATASGPFPPKVNQATRYTIHWFLRNYATDVSSVTVSAYLQSGSTAVGDGTSTVPSSTVHYDPGTGLVTWTLPVVPATAGFLTKPLEATFQLENTPAVNQVGSEITLLGQTSLTGTDNFTGKTLSASDQAITSQLPDDPSVNNVSNKTVSP
ncbi:MAG TPA: hypothetical protein VMU07_04005 [Candidatus Paceibacterota bacterium]|nr:hypothetical protein [Candidatus Paceibacterota bacterium]